MWPVVALVLLAMAVMAATLLPWATYENRALEFTTDYGAGAVGYIVAALALGSVACAVLGMRNRSATLQNTAVVSSAACLVTSIVLALTRISAANDAATSQIGASRTSYEAGAVGSVVASAALLIVCVAVRRNPRSDGEGRVTATSEPPLGAHHS